jgi:hypothetical protein
MKAVLSRKYDNLQTLGRLIIFDENVKKLEMVTIELPDNGNQKNTSCIPEGIYEIEKIVSPTKGECFHVLNVPKRDNILIHVGNYASGSKIDTKGCILVGLWYADINEDGSMDVAESKAAMGRLLNCDITKLYII